MLDRCLQMSGQICCERSMSPPCREMEGQQKWTQETVSKSECRYSVKMKRGFKDALQYSLLYPNNKYVHLCPSLKLNSSSVFF